jgi:hypothetical protein
MAEIRRTGIRGTYQVSALMVDLERANARLSILLE